MNTKKIITDAAFSLFREFPFDVITVQMILNKAEVSRKTFYKYFEDKYELMELYYRRTMDQYIQKYYSLFTKTAVKVSWTHPGAAQSLAVPT